MQATTIPSIFDVQALSSLKRQVKADDPEALRATARQFEALLIQTMLKSMRATVPQQGLTASDETRFYQELLDAQLAQAMAAKGGLGLAAMIEKQLTASLPTERKGAAVDHRDGRGQVNEARATPAAAGVGGVARESLPDRLQERLTPEQRTFVARVAPYAEEAAARLGVPAPFLIAQAALESGWGRAEPRLADGRPSFNLFGIKAGAGWNGAVAEAWSKEFLGGRWVDRLERFRAYGSYAEAFADYARLLANRYGPALQPDAQRFAQGLSRLGYASDPGYADKLVRMIAQMS